MGRRFSFFDWASGRSSPGKKRSDLRRMMILFATGIVLVALVVVVRKVFWSEPHNHEHEKGPHGGTIVAINKEDPHYHAEFVVKADGRIRLFLFGDKTNQVVEVRPQTLVAQVREGKKEGPTFSVVLRPAENMSRVPTTTSQFWGRLSPDAVGKRLSFAIKDLEIEGRPFAFLVEVVGHGDHHGDSTTAAEVERKLVLKPGGRYLQSDIDAAKGDSPSMKYKNVESAHTTLLAPGDPLCPVTRLRADSRLTWVVGGKTYQFCCPPCIVEFVALAKEHPDELVLPEDLVYKP